MTFDWVTVGDPGNPADTEVMNDGTTGYGGVGYAYRISKYEVTNAQYAEFLNAVADTDTWSVYHSEMGTYGGITQSGSSGSYTYAAVSGRESLPVNFVSEFDAMRFANWLHNGQPNTGSQLPTTTEDGAYTFDTIALYVGAPPPPDPNTHVSSRNPGAAFFVPSESEWYKAAYYDPSSSGYFDYPTGSNAPPTCAAPTGDPNSANCGQTPGDTLTPVGSYPGSPSPYGTFDQGGNVWEWNEARPNGQPSGVRGAGSEFAAEDSAASNRNFFYPYDSQIGFRIASIPEPGTGALALAGLLGLAGSRRGMGRRPRNG